MVYLSAQIINYTNSLHRKNCINLSLMPKRMKVFINNLQGGETSPPSAYNLKNISSISVVIDEVQSALWDIPTLGEGLELINRLDPHNDGAVELVAGRITIV